ILIILSNLSFFLGLLSKENAIMFVAIVPLAVYFFFRVPLKKTLLITFPLAITALAFVFVRFLVLGQVFSSGIPRELLNNPFLDATADQRFGTIMYTLGLYIKLLFFPHPLTHDYYPYQIPLVSLTDIRSLIPVIMYSAMIFYLLRRFSKKEIVVFGLAFYLLTLLIVSNLLFAVGTFMNERFIYMPSLGFVIIMIYLVAVKLPSRFKSKAASKIVVLAIMFPVLLLFSIKTYTRNQVWKDDFTLFSTDVLVSGNSIKCNISAGGDYINKAVNEPDTVKKMEYFGHSMQYLEKALRLAPSSINALVLYGNLNALYLKDYKKAIEQYFKVLYIDQSNEPAMTNAIKILESVDNQKDCAYKLKSYQFLLKINPANSDICYNIGRLYGRYAGNLDSAGIYLEKAIKLSPGDIKAYKDLGIICSMKKDFARAIELFKTAAALDPKDIQVKQNLEVTYRIMQREKK
ncbi:MAG: tetratricopeptide repeat protein, partial [Bacteroidota bacterium]